ncbi:MAG TPA: MFS transporter [Candidatus Saccharimonadales bacterium]|nr:MFS transporter [Candidatus Saccharimonadales bacterium]
MAKATSAHEHAARFSARQKKIALVVGALAFVMDLLDSTIVNVAIPSIQHNLGASYATIQWLVAGYSLAFALLLVTGGRMGDVFGYKKLFMWGVGGFTLASLFSGVAWDPSVLIVARFLQGSMAALMVPQVMSMMQIMYKPAERGAINGLFGALGGMAASLGPIIGGLLIKANIFGWDWRPIFLINVPVGIFALIAARKYLPDGKSPHPLKLDIFGTFLILGTLFLLIYPLIQGRELGWPTWSYIMMVASLPVLAVFARWQQIKQKRDGSPLVVPELFRKSSFTLGMLVNVIVEGAMISFFLTFTLLIQIGLGYSAIHAALTGLPVAFGIAMTMATAGAKLVVKIGARTMSIGTIVMSSGLLTTAFMVHRYQLATHSWQFIPGLLLFGVGMGLIFVSLFAVVLNDVDVSHAGSAPGVLNAIQQVGGAVGVAIIGVILFGSLKANAPTSFQSVQPQLRAQLTAAHVPATAQPQIMAGIKQCYVDTASAKDQSVTPASCKQAESSSLSPALAADIKHDALQANAHNFSVAFKKSTIFEISLLALTFILSWFLPKHIRAEALAEGF